MFIAFCIESTIPFLNILCLSTKTFGSVDCLGFIVSSCPDILPSLSGSNTICVNGAIVEYSPSSYLYLYENRINLSCIYSEDILLSLLSESTVELVVLLSAQTPFLFTNLMGVYGAYLDTLIWSSLW